MRHLNGTKKLGRNGTHRRALMRNMAIALFRHERITTTEVKAKALRSFAEKLITLGKQDDLHHRRLVARELGIRQRQGRFDENHELGRDSEVVQKLFNDIGPRFKERPGGYTRVLKTVVRRGDAAQEAIIELVDYNPHQGHDHGDEEKPKAKAK